MARRQSLPGPRGDVIVDSRGGLVREVTLRRTSRGHGNASGPLAADLRRYFSGEFVDFSRYEVDFGGYTPFERAVLEATRRIPHGERRTYGDIARAIGKPDAARAVGQALGKNRTCIVVPCPRVLAANGLGGFGAGLLWKRALLALEDIQE